MGVLFDLVNAIEGGEQMKSKEKLRSMRVDIRLGLTAKELAKKYHISEGAAKCYRANYLKAIEKQKELKVNANY